MQDRLEREVDEVELYCYPSEQETRFAYYEDDGVSLDYQQGKYALSDITLKGDEKSVTLTLAPHAESRVKQWSAVIAAKSAPCSVTSGAKEIPFTWDEERLEIHISNIASGITEIKFQP